MKEKKGKMSEKDRKDDGKDVRKGKEGKGKMLKRERCLKWNGKILEK